MEKKIEVFYCIQSSYKILDEQKLQFGSNFIIIYFKKILN